MPFTADWLGSLVKNIRSGLPSSSPQLLTEVNGTMVFKARNATNGIELWKSDGTEAGTVQVKDIWAGGLSSTPFDLTNVNGTFYFNAYEGPATARELWKSDGTELGTMLIKDINSGSGSSTPEEFTPQI